MRSILLLPLVDTCLKTIDVCIWSMLVYMSVVVIVWGFVGMFVVYRPLLKIVFLLALESQPLHKHVVCLCKGCDVCVFVCIVKRGAVGDRVWEV